MNRKIATFATDLNEMNMKPLYKPLLFAFTFILFAACKFGKAKEHLDFHQVKRSVHLRDSLNTKENEFAILYDTPFREMEIELDMNFLKATINTPQAVCQQINNKLTEILVNQSDSLTPEEAADKYIEQHKEDFLREKITYIYYSHLKGRGDFGLENVLNYRIEEEEFTGGAHPLTTVTILRFNTTTGDFITLDQICPLSSQQKLKEMLLKKLMKDKNASTMEELYQMGILDRTEMFVSKNFSLGKDSIEFYYNEYEIAPYAYGPCIISLGYDEVVELTASPANTKDKHPAS